MSDTASALRAAREAQSENLSPELYRQANDWWLKARQEYKFKNFSLASEFAERARSYAEQAEFNSLRQGASRQDISEPEPTEEPKLPEDPSSYEAPQGKPVESFSTPPSPPSPSQASPKNPS